LSQTMYIPYALYLEGQVIKLYDAVSHKLAPENDATGSTTGGLRNTARRDPRWVKIRRPFIVVGGELTLEGLDLVFDDTHKFYEAPFQVKANGGMLLIDDFGRQKVHPTDLLNRWIVPLEKRVDFLTLHTGKKFEIPFDQLIVFSTNLDPKELVDEAFLRRIKYKIEITDPSEEAYRHIFRKVCEAAQVPYSDQAVTYLIQHVYKGRNLALRACHPRDIVNLVKDAARYWQVTPALSKELIDQAVQVFLVALQ
jgi:predicted ATPase with chaperone activity